MRQVRAYQEHWSDSIAFIVRDTFPGSDVVAYAQPEFTMVSVTGDALAVQVKPTFYVGIQEAQKLMDDLWACGLRPTDSDSPGELAATKKHLDDYRQLTTRLLAKVLE